ncbi:MAG: hypothetical protein DI547_17110 [Sphingobium sp.]|nr:MAG: hypothetical protein DI547_17110 [Sphingobium sp.]
MKPWQAWIAGPCHWYLCHSKGKTKPCLHHMTNGALKCPRCEVGEHAEEVGYLPLYRMLDGKPVMVIVHEASREQIDGLKLHAPVQVGRGAERSDPVWVQPMLVAPRYTSSIADRLKPAKLTPSLLKIWKVPGLMEWLLKRGAAPAIAAPDETAAPPVKSDGKPFDGFHAAAARRYAAPASAGSAVDDVLGRALKGKQPKPSTNGDGHH